MVIVGGVSHAAGELVQTVIKRFIDMTSARRH
jgi:hypothetical protein